MSGASSLEPGGLSPRVKGALVAGLTLFMSIQLFHTFVLRGSNFPFADNAFFNYVGDWEQEVMRVVLHEDTGRTVTVYPWNVAALDYWVGAETMGRIYHPEGDLHHKQERFARLVLQWTNGEPWTDFDEFYPMARPSPGARFVGFDVILEQTDFRLYRYGEPLRPLGVRTLYSYREPSPP